MLQIRSITNFFTFKAINGAEALVGIDLKSEDISNCCVILLRIIFYWGNFLAFVLQAQQGSPLMPVVVCVLETHSYICSMTMLST